ncbi:hypothetical protein HOF56_02930 [Candidatus Peribacteria bacterium]|jgi:hypothetical protein|nr:hypothetical protein [Candidatus Peribacteria bacterium]MBT4020899.1 hypothetical protein [Candidatus Peribacteria bacterium]MBT4240615.1 hypothetical protein [Candidatus Peribacteria bacterium]MBT4474621.1 hypothetical protein [Candidatus Peribacteria bacterium]
MIKNLSKLWLVIIPVAICLINVSSVHAATNDVSVRFRPHCEKATGCSEFIQKDANTLSTYGLKVGDKLDIDIILNNPSAQPIQSIQSWISYDPMLLKGVDVSVGDEFPLVAPGEKTFDEIQGLVKIGASNVSGGVNSSQLNFARVTFEVLAEDSESKVSFYEFSLLGQEGKTKALVVEAGRTVNVLKVRPRDLQLCFGDCKINPGPTVTPPPANNTDDGFTRLQPSGIRVSTNESDVYVIWNSLSDARVQGYNLYYGTVSGRYVHRRTVHKMPGGGIQGVTVGDLPIGQDYYFAVTAFDSRERETEFSYEVMVEVGDPSSSTAPFGTSGNTGGSNTGGSDITGSVIDGGKIAGGTGFPAHILLIAAIISAGFSIVLIRSSK